MSGTYCEKTVTPKRQFEPKSFRWKQSGKSWVLIGCPKGSWRPRKERCKVGTRAYKLLVPARGKRKKCPVGTRRTVKGT